MNLKSQKTLHTVQKPSLTVTLVEKLFHHLAFQHIQTFLVL